MTRTLFLFLLSFSSCASPPLDDPGNIESTTFQGTDGMGTTSPGILTTTEDGSTSSSSGDLSSGSESSSTTEPLSPCDLPERECSADRHPNCNSDCTWETRKIFVTSGNTPGSFGTILVSIPPDKFCNLFGCKAEETDCNFTALVMKEAGVSFFAPLENFKGRYVLPSGAVVAEGDWNWLADPLLHPINEDQNGATIHGRVWTGFDGAELWHACPVGDLPWKTTEGKGVMGMIDEVDRRWYAGEDTEEDLFSCAAKAPVICVESD